MDEQRPLEEQLVDALLADDEAGARRIAAALHERGFTWEAISAAIQSHPALEERLWDVMSAVRPLSRRAAKRRAIKAAEERDWGDWEEGKKP